MTGLTHGALAGAAGTTALDAVTYGDMVARGRGASGTPRRTAEAIVDLAGQSVPGSRGERSNRLDAGGALSGIAVGVGVGAVFGWLHEHGLHLGPVSGPVVIGATAMAATDLPMAELGVSDPSTWTAGDWVADAVPHLVYGWVTHRAICATSGHDRVRPRHRGRWATFARAATAGVATGARSTAAVAALALTPSAGDRSGGRKLLDTAAVALAGGELVADKLPATPARSEPPGVAARVGLSAAAGAAIARRAGQPALPSAVVAVAAAVASGAAGLWWREQGAASVGLSPMAAAVAEDVASLGLAALAAG